MDSDINLMVKATIVCKSTASQGFSFVQLSRLLIKSLMADTARRRFYSQKWSIHPAWPPVKLVSSAQCWIISSRAEQPGGTFTT